MTEEPVGLRERTRRAVRAELQAVAIDLFLRQGFDATTVEQIAEAAGLSRRSFFRYFSSKDEVLARALADTGDAIAADIAARPDHEPPWVALRRGFTSLVEQADADPRAVALTRAMLASATLQNSHAAKQASWQRSIAGALQARLAPSPHRRLQAEALAAAALACLTSAQQQWVSDDGAHPLGPLLDTAMNAVSPIP
jgi:AcrR family transcriptional regulator